MNNNPVTVYYRGNRIETGLSKQSSKENCILAYNSFVGVEIEGEGMDAGALVDDEKYEQDTSSYWRIMRDGSLRGLNFEAVFNRPYSGYKVQIALRKIDELLSQYEVQFNPRTSVHVHVNIQDMTVAQLSKFYAVYLIFEEALFKYVGYNRKDSNYCTKLADDEFAIDFLRTLDCEDSTNYVFSPREPTVVHNYGLEDEERFQPSKYHALNVRTLGCFGTFEFRHHPGDHDKNNIFNWINILLKMKKWAIESAITTDQIPMYVSSSGIFMLCQEVFEEHADKLEFDGMERSGYVGLRAVQAAFIEMRPPIFQEPSEKSIASRLIKKHEEDKKAIRKRIYEKFSDDKPALVDFIANRRYTSQVENDIAMELYHELENREAVTITKIGNGNYRFVMDEFINREEYR